MLEDYSARTPIATWNPARGVWETSEANLLCEHLEPYAEVWRTSGMTVGGKLFALPTQEHRTTELASSSSPIPETSLLRSPKASEGQGGALGEAEALRRGNTVGVRDQVLDLVAEQGLPVSRSERNDALLPTPAVAHLRKHDEDLDDYMKRRADFAEGKTTGMPGASLGVAVRLVENGVDNWQDSALFPTPRASRGASSTETVYLLGMPVASSKPDQLLPTPNTMDSLPAREGEAYELNLRRGDPDGVRREMSGNLREVVVHDVELLPTTTASDWKGANHSGSGSASSRGIATVVEQATNWGRFEPAIRRWEKMLGRSAPAPTIPDGKDGAHRLSSLFTEWMMGLPIGWITDAGLGRAAELKMAGNGVVPQQAALALRRLLGGSVSSIPNSEAMLPTPTVADTRDGKHLRSVAVENLKNGRNRGINLNHLVENIGVDWEEGDTFTVIDGRAVKD